MKTIHEGSGSQQPSVTRARALTPRQLAEQCLAEARNNPDKAIALAGKRARGWKLRATVVVIGNALLRASRRQSIPQIKSQQRPSFATMSQGARRAFAANHERSSQHERRTYRDAEI